MSGQIAAVCTVQELFPVPAVGLMSGINKRPRSTPVRLLPHGVLGDVQGDREHHGGLFKAVYAFARETREELARREGREDLADGFFGENLVTEGIDTDEVIVGTRWRVGTAVIEATVPRTPCRTFATWMGDRAWPRRFMEFGKCGAYFRVHEPGEVSAGDAIEVSEVPDHGVSVGAFFRGLSGGLEPAQATALLDWARAAERPLYESMARTCLLTLERAGIAYDFPAQLRTDGRGH
ncbi:MAG: MOSC domain-containing protein [Dermabacter sp.]|nr:MOSC domain-containing protein [Dermabacter sp.]